MLLLVFGSVIAWRPPTALRATNDVQDVPGVKFRTTDETPAPVVTKRKAQMNTINARLLADIEKKKSEVRVDPPLQAIEREDVDVSDVNPVVAIVSSAAAITTAYYMWQFTGFMAASFMEHPYVSDFYPITRFAGFLRQAIVALATLLTGLTGMAGLGVGLLGAKVALEQGKQ